MSPQESQHKGKTGLRRLFNAAGYSWAGLCAAFRHEAAFRLDVLLFVVCTPLAFVLEADAIRRVLLIAPLFLILVIELLNSAIEAIVDRVSLENHPLAKRAKDIGSAAVLISLASAATIWLLVLTD